MNNRLQKKCFVAATGFHLLLLVILFVGPAFFSRDDTPKDLQLIDVIPANLIDAPFVGGGSPTAKPPPPAPPQPPEPERQPPKQEKIVKPEPEKEIKTAKPDPESLEPKPHKPQVSLKPVVRETGKPPKKPVADSKSDADSQARAEAERRRAIASAARSIKEGLSSSTSVEVPGPGGEAYAGYENVIQSIYQHRYDQELPSAGEMADKVMEVEVSVTVERGGAVVSSRLLKPSANAALNKLVQRVLDKVTYIAPFPQKSKDQQRTFNIVFDLKPKKALG